MEFPSGFNAFGKLVPNHRIDNAIQWFSEITDKKYSAVEVTYYLTLAVKSVEKDHTDHLFTDLKDVLDITGIYRLLAILTTG